MSSWASATQRGFMLRSALWICPSCRPVALRCCSTPQQRAASSASSRWKARQGKDMFAREARVQGLKSRAAFKLLEMDAKYKLFKPGHTVVDLGYAPGSWSQVAVERTKPSGIIVGIDLIPAQPPRGVSTIQGNFLAPDVQAMVKKLLVRHHRQREAQKSALQDVPLDESKGEDTDNRAVEQEGQNGEVETDVTVERRPSYIDMEKAALQDDPSASSLDRLETAAMEKLQLVDVILSDMSEPWEQTSGFGMNTLSNPYRRLMNTSGNAFRDHAGSMDLCTAALHFAIDTLRPGGHLVCKFYQGAEDKDLEQKLKKVFAKVHREKPDSSRSESKEAYFVALRKKKNPTLQS